MVSFDANPSEEDCVSICPRSIAKHAPLQPKVDFIQAHLRFGVLWAQRLQPNKTSAN